MDKDKITLKSRLIKETALKTYHTQDDVKPIINAFIDLIIEDTVKTGKVSISGFGSFFMATRKERTGRNPRTGEAISIPKCYAARFSAGKRLKTAVTEEFRRQEAQKLKIKKAEIAKAKRLTKTKAKVNGKTSSKTPKKPKTKPVNPRKIKL